MTHPGRNVTGMRLILSVESVELVDPRRGDQERVVAKGVDDEAMFTARAGTHRIGDRLCLTVESYDPERP